MKNDQHDLVSIWQQFPDLFSPEHVATDTNELLNLISDLFIVGEYYYFIIEIHDNSIPLFHPNLTIIHGLSTKPNSLHEIVDLIHPEDLSFVLNAEEYCHQKITQIGVCYLKQLKSSYCFRMKVEDGSYKLFHHQSISLILDVQNRLAKSLNIHTCIDHLTVQNNYIATVMGIKGRSDFYQKDFSNNFLKLQNSLLTKRELQIIQYIAKGYSSEEISKKLEITSHTVRVHRKKILAKTNTQNSSSLIMKCIELGLI